MNATLAQPNPIHFVGSVTATSVNRLIGQIKKVPDEKLTEVIFATTGGSHNAALAFFGWMRRFSHQKNVRAVASGQVSSAGVTMFLAFDRRTADDTAQFRLHLLTPDTVSKNPALALFVKESEEQLIDLIESRTKLSKKVVRELMEKQIPLSRTFLIKSGICNE